MANSARARSTCAAGALSERLRQVSSWRSSAVSGRTGSFRWRDRGHLGARGSPHHHTTSHGNRPTSGSAPSRPGRASYAAGTAGVSLLGQNAQLRGHWALPSLFQEQVDGLPMHTKRTRPSPSPVRVRHEPPPVAEAVAAAQALTPDLVLQLHLCCRYGPLLGE